MTPKHKQIKQPHFLMSAATHKRVLLLLLALALTLIIIPKGGFVPDYYSPGDIASRDIKTPRGFLLPEPELTEKKKQDAEQAVLSVYDYDSRPNKAAIANLVEVFTLLNAEAARNEQRVAAESMAKDVAVELPAVAETVVATEVDIDVPVMIPTVDVAVTLGVDISDEQLIALRHLALEDLFVEQFSHEMNRSLNRKIVGNLELFQSHWQGAISIRDLASQKEVDVVEVTNIRQSYD